jgi:hypothetical protein
VAPAGRWVLVGVDWCCDRERDGRWSSGSCLRSHEHPDRRGDGDRDRNDHGERPGMPSYAIDVRSDDGANHRVEFSGRNPKKPDLWIEDSYRGVLPDIGGRYRIVGAQGDASGGPIVVNECIPHAAVTVLSAPPLPAKRGHGFPFVLVAAGILVLLACSGVWITRRRAVARWRTQVG